MMRQPATIEDSPALVQAVSTDDIDLVHGILESNADPNSFDNNQQTALHIATMNTHQKMVALLLQYGADPTCKNQDGLTPLDLAVTHDSLAIFELLLTKTNTPQNANIPQCIAETIYDAICKNDVDFIQDLNSMLLSCQFQMPLEVFQRVVDIQAWINRQAFDSLLLLFRYFSRFCLHENMIRLIRESNTAFKTNDFFVVLISLAGACYIDKKYETADELIKQTIQLASAVSYQVQLDCLHKIGSILPLSSNERIAWRRAIRAYGELQCARTDDFLTHYLFLKSYADLIKKIQCSGDVIDDLLKDAIAFSAKWVMTKITDCNHRGQSSILACKKLIVELMNSYEPLVRSKRALSHTCKFIVDTLQDKTEPVANFISEDVLSEKASRRIPKLELEISELKQTELFGQFTESKYHACCIGSIACQLILTEIDQLLAEKEIAQINKDKIASNSSSREDVFSDEDDSCGSDYESGTDPYRLSLILPHQGNQVGFHQEQNAAKWLNYAKQAVKNQLITWEEFEVTQCHFDIWAKTASVKATVQQLKSQFDSYKSYYEEKRYQDFDMSNLIPELLQLMSDLKEKDREIARLKKALSSYQASHAENFVFSSRNTAKVKRKMDENSVENQATKKKR